MKLAVKTRFKKLFIVFLLAIFSLTSIGFGIPSSVDASSHVRGYTKKSGKYVVPHYRTNRNKTKIDNWSTKGNRNPYTGKKGTKKLK